MYRNIFCTYYYFTVNSGKVDQFNQAEDDKS